MVLLMVFLAGCPRGGTPQSATSDVGEARDLLFWELERGGAVSHMLGTCHMPIPIESFLPAEHQDTVKGARLFLTEADLSSMTMEDLSFIWTETAGARAELSAEAWLALSRRVGTSYPAPALAHAPLWFADMMAMMGDFKQASNEASGVDGEATSKTSRVLDLQVTAMMSGTDAEVRYLETIQEQVAFLDGHNDDLVAEMERGRRADREPDVEREAMFDVCATGDLSSFEELLAHPDYEDFYRSMFGDRNHTWVKKILPEIQSGGVFI